MFVSLKRIITWGWQSFRRNSGASFAMTVVMVIVISLITSLFLLQKSTQFTIATLEKKVALVVYFKKDALESDILAAKRELALVPAIKEVRYISKEQALEAFTKRHKENPVVMESLAMVGANPLMAHLNIETKTPDQYEKVSEFLKKSSFASLIDHINYSQVKPVIAKIQQITTTLTNLGVLLTVIFGLVAVLVAFTTVRLAIYNLREEISIMRLVGASNWFIRGPLLIQGMIAGFFATLISLALFVLLLFLVGPKLEVFLPGLNIFAYFVGNLGTFFLIQLAIGIGLGVFSTFLAIRKYLAV